MPTIAQTIAGASLKISATLPVTEDAAGFAVPVYTTIGEVTEMSSVGKAFDSVEHRPIGDRKKYVLKGGYSNGEMQLKMARMTAVTSDAGQVILKAASDSDANYSFKVTFQDGSDFYFVAKAMDFVTDLGSLNSILGLSVKLTLQSDIVETV